jgi:hypothetical protein
MTAM